MTETTPQKLRKWAQRALKSDSVVKLSPDTVLEIANEIAGYRKLLRSMQRAMATHCGHITEALGPACVDE